MSSLFDNFLEMENKNNLFEIKTNKDIPIWQILRYDVFDIVIGGQYVKRKVSFFTKIWSFIITLSSQIKLFIYNYDYLYFGASRIINGEYIEPTYNNLVMTIEKSAKCLFVETNFVAYPIKIKHARSLTPILKLISKYISLLNKSEREAVYIILKAICFHFPNIDINKRILFRILTIYKLELLYYSFILNTSSVKKVFFTKNGMPYALISAARKNNSVCYEFQHGDIVSNDVSISYSNTNATNLLIPDYHLTFSNYWTKEIQTKSKCVEIGSSYISIEHQEKNYESGILVIVDLSECKYYVELAISLSDNYPFRKIYFKLHPKQQSEKKYYIKLFLNYKNITVLSNEATVQQLCKTIKLVIGSYSTAMYEAYDESCNLYIFFETKNRVYTFPCSDGVFYYTNTEQLLQLINKTYCFEVKRERVYFKKFNFQELKKVISNQ